MCIRDRGEVVQPGTYSLSSFSTVFHALYRADVYKRQAQVTLITGPVQLKTQHSGIIRVDVESAEEMYKACLLYTSLTMSWPTAA